MTRLTDEVLMAYADGALPPAEAARVATSLETDIDARAAVEEFRRTAALSRAAFADVLVEPVPAPIVRAVLTSGTRTAGVTDLARHRQSRLPHWRTALPLAASLALVIGLAAVLFLRSVPSSAPAQIIALGPVEPEAPLAAVLEKHPGGTPFLLTGREGQTADRLMAVATFRDRKARICREVELLDKSMQPHTAAVACRDPARGTWSVEGVARIATTAPSGGSDFVPSGAEEKDALDGLLTILGATRALPAEEEQRLMRQGWK